MRRLYRSRTNLMIGGVCGGLGEYFAVDPAIIRILFVLLVLAGGSGVLLYLLLWIIIPPQEGGPGRAGETEAAPAPSDERSRLGLILGIALIALGLLFLLRNLCWIWFPWLGHRFWFFLHRTVWPFWPALRRSFWPLLLMALGILLLLRRRKGE